MVPIRLSEGFVAPHPQQGVLDDDPLSGKGGVVVNIGLWARLATGFATGVAAKTLRVQLLDAHVSQVAEDADLGRQTLDKARLFEQGHGRCSHQPLPDS